MYAIPEITFAGATEVVQGSQHALSIGTQHFLVDMGGVMGKNDLETRLKSVYPLPHSIKGIILTHGHFDHYGKLSRFIESFGYRGPVYGTQPTLDIWSKMGRKHKNTRVDFHNEMVKNILMGKIGRHEMNFLGMEPLHEDAYDRATKLNFDQRINTIEYWQHMLGTHMDSGIEGQRDLGIPVKYEEKIQLTPEVSFTLHKASHIIGSAQVFFQYVKGGSEQRILFTGDIGPSNMLYSNPAVIEDLDCMVFDATNGDISSDSYVDPMIQVKEIINSTMRRKGQAYFATFTVDRLQKVAHMIKKLYQRGDIPRDVKYVIDSPSGVQMTNLYQEYARDYLDNMSILDKDSPFVISAKDTIGRNARRSRVNSKYADPMVILSAPGMISEECNGRLMRYLTTLKQKGDRIYRPNMGINDARNSLVLCGYQAEELGQRLRDSISNPDIDHIHIKGKRYPLRAQIHNLRYLSGHMYKDQAKDFIKAANPKKLILVHAEDDTRHHLAEYLADTGVISGDRIYCPKLFDRIRVQ